MTPPDRIFTGNMPIIPAPHVPAPPEVQPLYLLSDSQLLFRPADDGAGEPWLRRVVHALPSDAPRAAYLGASNGDRAEFASLFVAAMAGVGIGAARCRAIPADPSEADERWLAAADLVVLAGGDPEVGWEAFRRTEVREMVEARHRDGAALLGISAGAMQLGLASWPETAADPAGAAFPTWGLVPCVVGAHEEDDDWRSLRAVVESRGLGARGIGLPRGGGLVHHPDGTVEAIRHPVIEIENRGERLAVSFLFPRTETDG